MDTRLVIQVAFLGIIHSDNSKTLPRTPHTLESTTSEDTWIWNSCCIHRRAKHTGIDLFFSGFQHRKVFSWRIDVLGTTTIAGKTLQTTIFLASLPYPLLLFSFHSVQFKRGLHYRATAVKSKTRHDAVRSPLSLTLI